MNILQARLKQFEDKLKQELTDQNGEFYETTALDIINNFENLMCCSPQALELLANDNAMDKFQKLMKRPDLLDANGVVSPKAILGFTKEEFGFDILQKIPFAGSFLKSFI
jgi:hypothetical protein